MTHKQIFSYSKWLNGEAGQDLIEYSLILLLVITVAIIGIEAVGSSVSAVWSELAGLL